MKKRQTFAAVGAGIGIVAAAVSASPLTIADLAVGGAITGAIGFFIGKSQEKNDGE
jgi:hypothetical protein